MSRVDASPARRLDASSSRHVPALDGLRGVAVLAVLCYHGALGWMRGGFLGVSTFFTLSGFLIAGLVHDEIRSTGRLDFRRFWSRGCAAVASRVVDTRSHCCLPGVFGAISYAGFAATCSRRLVMSRIGGWFTPPGVRFIFATPHQCSTFVARDRGAVLRRLSDRLLRGSSRLAPCDLDRGGVRSVAVVSFVAGAWLTRSGDVTRAYYGADTRAAELLVGVTLAYVLTICLAISCFDQNHAEHRDGLLAFGDAARAGGPRGLRTRLGVLFGRGRSEPSAHGADTASRAAAAPLDPISPRATARAGTGDRPGVVDVGVVHGEHQAQHAFVGRFGRVSRHGGRDSALARADGAVDVRLGHAISLVSRSRSTDTFRRVTTRRAIRARWPRFRPSAAGSAARRGGSTSSASVSTCCCSACSPRA